MDTRPTGESDPLLRPLLQAATPAARESALQQFTADAGRVARRVVQQRLTRLSQEASSELPEALANQAVASVGTRLQDAGIDPRAEPIPSFTSMVVAEAHIACDDYVRERRPRRAALSTRLRYLLEGHTGQRGLAFWDTPDGQRLCGFEQWRARNRRLIRTGRYQQVLDDPREWARVVLPDEEPAVMNPATLLTALFNWTGCPVEFDDLLDVVGALCAVDDAPASPASKSPPSVPSAANLSAPEQLRRLWSVLRSLPSRQQAAYLLPLADEQDRPIIELLTLLGLAGPTELAQAMGVPVETLAGRWKALPLGTPAVAELLDCSQWEVRALRSLAQEQLVLVLRDAA